MKNIVYDCIVIGGGAAGMMAALSASMDGKRTCILEKNPVLGRKLGITGGGRCNITNATPDLRQLLKQYGASEQALYSAFSQFGVNETFDFFASLGLNCVVEEKNRAFPQSQNAHDVVSVLQKKLEELSVDIFFCTEVTSIICHENTITQIHTTHGDFSAKHYILATGGLSRPETGSTGDGFHWLETLGHTVISPTPSLVPLHVAETWIEILSGIRLDMVKMKFYSQKKCMFKTKGEVLFTHFGISGPTVINISPKVSNILHEGDVQVLLDFFPHYDEGAFDRYILELFESHKNKDTKNVLSFMISEKILFVLQQYFAFDFQPKVHSFSAKERKRLIHILKNFQLEISGLAGFEKAIIADGGVPLDEIDTRTFRSKKIKNLSIVGDLLHIHRPSGGYSLQLCWTSGWVAGHSIMSG